MAKGYTTKTKVAQFLNTTISMSDGDFAVLIGYAEKIIDQLTGRNFIADASASVRLFDGNGKQIMSIDDCVAITTVEVGNDDFGGTFTTIAAISTSIADGYFKLPSNAVAKLEPITQLKLRSRCFLQGVQNQKITAKWGYSVACPDDVSMACTILTAGIYNYNRGGGAGNVKSERIGDYSVTYDNDNGWDDLERAKGIITTRTRINI